MVKAPVEFYFDFSSPYGYLAAHRVEALGAELGRDILWRPILLGVAFKATGQSPLIAQPLRGPYHLHDLKRTARRLGLPFQLPEGFPLPTMAAARAFYWAEAQSPAAAKKLALALYDACFAEGINITKGETVAEIAGKAGFDADAILAAIADPAIKERLRAETDGAVARGVFGSPFFIVDGEPFWGNDRLADLRDWIKSGGW
ncbi:2-hydroxychromene-2-carboxylate isomerase [Dongia mobilis]|uniref:2-hydroxychromene-2-carboxylate isomerase n=1 Tax=Dongia mobilis TaxID=578943 RepID=UPI002AC31744|nr:2-hydroxychromene-2-carboxylate isomerase [Dongia mobilis]